MTRGEDGGQGFIAFDLDGTLIDSRRDVTASLNYALGALGCKPLDLEEVTGIIGGGVRNLIRQALGLEDEKLFKKALAGFKQHYAAHLLDTTILYPCVEKALACLDGFRKVVVTNKPSDYSEKILEGLKVRHFFADISGGDAGKARKPVPDAVLDLMRKHEASPAASWIVGDSAIDVETGRNAGILTCAVTYGFGNKEDILRARPDYVLDSLSELEVIVKSA